MIDSNIGLGSASGSQKYGGYRTASKRCSSIQYPDSDPAIQSDITVKDRMDSELCESHGFSSYLSLNSHSASTTSTHRAFRRITSGNTFVRHRETHRRESVYLLPSAAFSLLASTTIGCSPLEIYTGILLSDGDLPCAGQCPYFVGHQGMRGYQRIYPEFLM